METKLCNTCHMDKPLCEFNLRLGKPRTICKTCFREYKRRWRKTLSGKASEKNSRQSRRAQIRKKSAERCRLKKQKLLDALGVTGCVRCSETHPPCLEFHHLSDKEKTISRMLKQDATFNKLLVEAKKCIVLCANCHRKEHFPV